MPRHPRVVVFALAALCMVIVAVSAGGQNQADRFAGVELTIVPVAGQVHMISRPGGGGNVGVFAGPDGVLLVDSLFALSTVIQLSPTCGHRKIPHPLVNRSSTSMPVDACGQAVCGLSKSRWARRCASTATAASTGRLLLTFPPSSA